jgi:release factor glutamine methyltransferase
MTVYSPEEDSFLFSDFLKKFLSENKIFSYLDMGAGSGILSETASNFLNKKNILAVDIDKESCEYVRKKGFKVLQSDLFSKIPKIKKFDLITFNAPYLPEDKDEDEDSQRTNAGGKKGDEISLKFLKQAKEHLNKNGKIFLLVSSLTPLKRLAKYNYKIVAEKNLFMEKILILEFYN